MKIICVGYIHTKFHRPVLNGSLVIVMKLQIQFVCAVVISFRGAVLFYKNIYLTTAT